DATTAESYLGRARYDRFFLTDNSVFLTGQAFRDQPSGFNSRFSGQIGYLRNFFNQPDKRRFWGEGGYDLTYENLTDPPSPGAATERIIHFARLFVGYEEHATRQLDLTAGIEGLMNILHPSDFRLNASLGAASKIADDF